MFALALTLILATVAYFLVTTLADLYPLNNVRQAKAAEQRTEVLTNAPLLALPAVLLALAVVFSLPVLAYVGAGLELVAAVGGLLLWWLPYVAGVTVPWATAGTGVSWAELHARTYAQTLTVLPRIGDRPRPNVEHMILHALMLTGAVCAFLTAAQI